ncbi:MAG: hypothetical protein DMG87_19285 [Acidobacteria bacterium]|nr:MAG: hypothetical protein DMG87_19285 [Acidobacteriota bacterium]
MPFATSNMHRLQSLMQLRSRGCVMPNSDSEELRAELLSLLDKQFEVLELSTCVTLTDEEKREYEAKETAHL